MLLPGWVESPNHEPEESILALELRPGPRAEGDLELVAQEQVLDHKVVPLTAEGGQSREEDAEEFKILAGSPIGPAAVLPSYSRTGSAMPDSPWARPELLEEPHGIVLG